MKNKLAFTGILILFVIIFNACEKFLPSAPEADSVMDAPIDGLTYEQNKLFLEGAEEFDEVYTTETGLGPLFVSTSCGSCHAGDNRGHPFTALTRFGQSDTTGNKFLDFGAPQIQHRALPGFVGETIPNGATSSKFLAPIASGVGFLELVSDEDILAMSDPLDQNGDGISGVPNWNTIPGWVKPFKDAKVKNGKYICRFGRKGATYNLHQQVAGAFNNDMGITTTFLPNNPFNYLTGTQPAPPSEPEITDASVNGVVFYLQTLQAPIQRNMDDEEVMKGKAVFKSIGCENCHKETLKTGPSPLKGLNQVEFHPYTDLLLHDMGAELNDSYTEGSALASEWRTTPLWGLGLSADAQGGKVFLLHDGRAHSISEAIQYHGGEGDKSRKNFTDLTESDRNALIKFLESL
ncbi:MAG: thiol oxidoreductase [Flavobacteriales bacterium]|nr:thiol oxidoreductase [Flavobacteriales bacterium]